MLLMATLLPMVGGTALPKASAEEAQIVEQHWLTMSDGVEIFVEVGGRGPLVDGKLPARPTILEFSTYAAWCCEEFGGPDFNYVVVHVRGMGRSHGSMDVFGPRSQQDVAEVLRWACDQPFSAGKLGLWGFSASAIMVYNSLHLELPCVQAAVVEAGTHEVYRDSNAPGGIQRSVISLGVVGVFTQPILQNLENRVEDDPASIIDATLGIGTLVGESSQHISQDQWWIERGMRGDVNDIPTLILGGFFDMQSRGPFEAFQELAADNTGGLGDSHLVVMGAHEGTPVGTTGIREPTERWYARHLLDQDNGIDREPTVQIWMADGDRQELLDGAYVHKTGSTWPLEGTRWETLYLDEEQSASAKSINDGSLSARPADAETLQPYIPIPSVPTASDPYFGFLNEPDDITRMDELERIGLSYTTPALDRDVTVAGPASLEIALTASALETDIYALITDVWPDGTVHPIALGRLRSSYPDIVKERSRTADGVIVQPYNHLFEKRFVTPGSEHRYNVEFFPIGNRFKQGHRLRLHIIGNAVTNQQTTPGPNLVRVGGSDGGSILRIPVIDGSFTSPASGTSPADGATNPSTPEVDAELGATGQGTLPATGGNDRLATWALLVMACALALRLRTRGFPFVATAHGQGSTELSVLAPAASATTNDD